MSVVPELVKRFEARLLPAPGTEVLLSKKEFSVGEWKLYLKAEGPHSVFGFRLARGPLQSGEGGNR